MKVFLSLHSKIRWSARFYRIFWFWNISWANILRLGCDYENMSTEHTQLKSWNGNFHYTRKVCVTNINMRRVNKRLFWERYKTHSSRISSFFYSNGFFIANGRKAHIWNAPFYLQSFNSHTKGALIVRRRSWKKQQQQQQMRLSFSIHTQNHTIPFEQNSGIPSKCVLMMASVVLYASLCGSHNFGIASNRFVCGSCINRWTI